MNILPHKSWHVRTKKNIARVRKDEAKAAEEEKERQRKIALAGQEARTAVLRQRANERLSTASASTATSLENVDLTIPLAPVTDIIQTDGHVNLFQDLEGGKRQGGVNEEAVEETKKEQEEYEKKIGYLVYLGQDSLEASKQRPWYAKIDRGGEIDLAKERLQEVKKFENSGYLSGLTRECNLTPAELKLAKFKNFQDPLQDIRKYLKTPGIAKKLESVKRKHSPEPSSKKSLSKKSKKEKKSKHKSHKRKKHKKKRSSSSSESSNSSGSDTDKEEKRKKSALEKLRAERLQREREERRKTDQLLAKLRGDKPPKEEEDKFQVNEKAPTKGQEREGVGTSSRVKQKYNSQFNPELARQNYDYS